MNYTIAHRSFDIELMLIYIRRFKIVIFDALCKMKLCAGKATPIGQIHKLQSTEIRERVKRNEMPYGVDAGWFSRSTQFKISPAMIDGHIRRTSKHNNVLPFRFDTYPIYMLRTFVGCQLYRSHVMGKQSFVFFVSLSIELNGIRNRSIYSFINSITPHAQCNVDVWMSAETQSTKCKSIILLFVAWFGLNLPHNASITVNKDAAGNRTDTLNSSIWSKSTENREKKMFLFFNFCGK